VAGFWLTGVTAVSAPENPVAPHPDDPGAKTTLPVAAARSPLPLAFVKDAQERFENFHYQLGGDHALYYNLHLSEVLHSAVPKPNRAYRPLDKALNPGLGDEVAIAAPFLLPL
jgi:hypothetical protein